MELSPGMSVETQRPDESGPVQSRRIAPSASTAPVLIEPSRVTRTSTEIVGLRANDVRSNRRDENDAALRSTC
jgi:hypothetical protein